MTREETREAVERVLRGEKEVFSRFVRAYGLSVRAYLYARVHHAEDVEDLAQEVFVSAYRSLGEFDVEQSFQSWLMGIARNRMLMHFRSRSRRQSALERFREEALARIESELSAFERGLRAERLERLLVCITQLPPRLKRVVRGHLNDARAAELAEELETTRGGIYTLQWRANQLLRACMERTT